MDTQILVYVVVALVAAGVVGYLVSKRSKPAPPPSEPPRASARQIAAPEALHKPSQPPEAQV
jgi:hypothetical protein